MSIASPARLVRQPLLLRRALAACLGLIGLTAGALAQQAPEPVTQAVRGLLESETARLPGRVSIDIVPLDARNQLAPCSALQPFLPGSTRASGRISVGVRCAGPANWTLYIQAQVSVLGQYLVTRNSLRGGQSLAPDDVALVEGDIGNLPEGILTDPARAIGQVLRYSVSAGQPLRAEMLRLPQLIRAGQRVKVKVSGSGFSVSNEGQALNNAGEGERVRVRMPNNQVLEGRAGADGSVGLQP